MYAIGDVVAILLTLGKPLPKAGVFAHGEAEVVAKNIAHPIAGAKATDRFDGAGECFIEVGDGKAGFGGGNWRWHLSKVLFEKSWLYTKV